jgi:hypothetical protein
LDKRRGQSNSATGSFSSILGGDGISLSKTNGYHRRGSQLGHRIGRLQ